MSINDEFFWKDPKLMNDNVEESDEETDNKNEMTDIVWLEITNKIKIYSKLN